MTLLLYKYIALLYYCIPMLKLILINVLTLGQQSWFIGSLRTPNIFVYSCFFVRRRAAGIPKASPEPPKASPKLPKASQRLQKHPQSLPETKKSPRDPKERKSSYCAPLKSQKLRSKTTSFCPPELGR